MFSEDYAQAVRIFFWSSTKLLRAIMCMYSFSSFCLRTGMVGAFYRQTVQITAWEISTCSARHANETCLGAENKCAWSIPKAHGTEGEELRIGIWGLIQILISLKSKHSIWWNENLVKWDSSRLGLISPDCFTEGVFIFESRWCFTLIWRVTVALAYSYILFWVINENTVCS